jgi:hypothetical protein
MVNECMVIGRRWNDTAGGKPKYSEKSFFHCHFVYQKFRTDRPGLEPGPPRLRASDKQPEPLHKFLVVFICRKLILCTNTMQNYVVKRLYVNSMYHHVQYSENMNFPTQCIYVFSMFLATEANSLSGIRRLVL